MLFFKKMKLLVILFLARLYARINIFKLYEKVMLHGLIAVKFWEESYLGPVLDSCWFVLTRVGLVLTRVSLVLTRVGLILTRVTLVLTRVDSCWFMLIRVDSFWLVFTSSWCAPDNANSLGKVLFLFLFTCSWDKVFVNVSFIKT